MAGMGAPPKDPSKRARRNVDTNPRTVLRGEVCAPPKLPARYAGNEEVRRWWETWAASPQADHFGATDWLFLLETLPLVAAYHEGELRLAAELRLRMASYGATPIDRLRLRMSFAAADEADAKRPVESSSRDRFGDLRSA